MFKLIEDPQNKKVMMANAKLPNHISKGIRKGAYISGKALVAELRSDMNRSKSGKTYKVTTGIGGKVLKKPRLHRASSSSEAPAVISGEFRKSVDFLVRGNRTLEFGSGNEDLAKDYARVLELGSDKMAARKPLGRTVKKLENQVKTNLAREVNKQIKAAGFNVKNI
tara:strand:- start:82 stop:582 length:501 start_codon:yes stop_codon:yes gene_type:complete